MIDFTAELGMLAARLDLDLSAEGAPRTPLVVLLLDRWRHAPPELTARAAGLVAGALPVTVGVLAGPPAPSLEPLITAASLTLAARAMPSPGSSGAAIVGIEDLPEAPDLEGAVERLLAAVRRSPRAAIACGQLLRQTAGLDTAAGLAAEAAVYSMLLGGQEFARWLAERTERTALTVPRHRQPNAAPVLASRDGGRLTIVLNDPARRNAFSAGLREALLDALLVAAADESVTSVELRGAGPSFCSGGDLDEFGTARDLVAAWLVRLSRAPWRVIDGIAPKVTVFAHGACVGAGIEMAAYAGTVVATPDAFFELPEVRMGLVPGAGGSVSVPRRVGRHRAAWLMLSGDRLPAATALRWGLVDEVRDAQKSDSTLCRPARTGAGRAISPRRNTSVSTGGSAVRSVARSAVRAATASA
jgi:enoyl-CoA hydratase/carnithine racemase